MPKRSQKNVPLHDDDRTRRKGSSGTIKSESGISQLHPAKQPPEISEPLTPNRRPSFGSSMKIKHISPGVAGAGQRDTQPIRFPKLEEYAHFHYDLVEIPTLKLSICADDASGYKHNPELGEDSGMFLVTVTGSAPKSWLIRRSLDNFATLDKQLHRCIFDRRFSHLEEINAAQLDLKSRQEIQTLLEGYLSHFSELAGGMVNCGSVLSWMEMDNRGHRLVATDDSGINTPAIAAAHVIKRYNAQAADEISLQVGDMISVIDMPASEDTIWWRGKRGFEVGFFPAECVEIIGDKVPFSMTTRIPEPLATAAAARRPLMRKHGKLLSFLRTFFSHRPPRNQLKQSGIVKERVFGCDLGEHLLNSGHDVPLLLKSCTDIIEQYGIVHGIYRLSGITSNIQKLRLAFDEDRVPDLTEECYLQDIHSISSLLKMYFRELPNPLLTYQLYDKFADAVRDEDNKLLKIHDVVQQLPPPHYRTTEYLMRHLARVAAYGAETEMHSKNLAIVWAPNLLRSKELEAGGGAAALQGVGIQAVVTECLICYSDIIFSDKMPNYGSQEAMKGQKKPRPKSLAISTPTRLLSLEEARERAFISHLAPKKFIDVGGGPKNLPSKYHTVIDLPGYRKKAPSGSTKENKAGSKKGSTSTSCVGGGNSGGGSSGGWKSIFSKPRSGSVKKTRKSSIQDSVSVTPAQAKALTEEDVHNWKRHLRSAKSAESLFSLTHTSSPRGSIGSRVSQSNTDASSIDRQALDLSAGSTSMFRPTHKRSLSSDASAVLQHHYLSHDVPLESSPTDGEDGRQSFIRGDSTRRALHHRRVPSAPNTPRQDRRIHSDESTETDIGMANSSSDNMDLNIEEFMYPKSASKGDINIDAAIKSRLQQVAGKTRSAKSNEELASSPLKRSAKTSSKSRKKAKGVDDGQEGSSEDELSPGPVHPSARKVTKSSSNVSEMTDASPYDNDDRESRMRRFYSRFHDYAEILSDDDTGMAYTPDSQGTMSVSSSGCNMQDVLDQIDNRLAMNAKLFPRQGIGDTSTYRVGDPLSANNQNQLQHRETGFSTTGMETTTTSTTSPTTSNNQETSFPANRQINKCKETEFPATSDSSPIETSRQETVKRSSLESQGSFSSSDVGRRSVEYISSDGGSGRSTQNAHKVTDSPSASAPSSTRVMRRHAEFIPSKKASSQDLQNLNKLLECLESEGDPAHAQPRRRSAEGQGSSRSTLDPSQAHHRHSHAHQHPSTQHSNFPNVEQIAGAGRMSKCLSVPSDIAKSLENVTESQSDMLSSVTISELSMSMNSFTNGVGDDGTVHGAGHGHRFGDSDPRRRRSTSLDSLTESDHLMTRTLREINRQMDVAFKHESFCGATSEMDKDSISHPQRLVASDLDLSTSPEVKAFTQSQFDQALAIAASRGNGRKNHGDVRTDQTSRSGQTACGVDMFPDSRLQDQSKSASLPPLCLPAIRKLSSSNESLSDSDSDQDDSLTYVTGAASSTSVGDLNLLSPTSNMDGNLSFSRSGSDCMISANDTPSTLTNTPEVSPGGVQVGAAPQQSLSPLTHQQLASSPSKGHDKNMEKQTHHQKEDHVLVEVPHVIRAPPRGGKNVTGQGEGQHHRHHHHHQHQQHHHHHVAKPDQGGVKGRTDVANMCKNRSSSSSSVTSSDSEEFDEVASPDEDEQQLREKSKPNLSLPLGIVTGGGGQMYGNFPPHETAPGQVVRRQHSPRVESKSPRSPMRMPGFGEAAAQEEHRDVAEGDVNNLQWDSSPLFAGRNQMDEERISSLCAAGLVSQRARLSRESSNSSLQSPDSSLSNVLFNNPRSPLHTPVREALPDLIQSTTQVRDTSGDAEGASNVPLQLALYHPDEFSMDISASVSGHGRPAAIVPSPSLPQVHSSMETVMVKQAVLRKSSTHDVISSPANSGLATGNDNQILSGNLRTVRSSNADVGVRKVDDRSGGGDFYRQRASSDSQAAHREARLPQTAGLESNIRHGYHGKGMSEENKRGRGAASGSQHVQKQYSYPTDKKMCNNSDDQVAMEIDNLCNKLVDDMNSPQNVQSRSRGCEEESKSYTVSASRDVRTDVNEQGAISMEVETSLEVKDAHSSPVVRERRVLRSASTDGENIETLMVSVQNSGGSVEDEVVQNVLNQGREILMSPTHSNESGYKEKLSGARSPPNTSTDSSGGGGDYSSPGRKSSISRIPRPRNISDLASSKSGSSGAGNASAKESSLHSSVHADTSPSSSSSSSSATSSSSRSRHVRRGSETSGVAGAKRQGHIRRSSDTKISELRTTSPMAQTQSLSPHKSEQTNISRNLPSPVGRIADSRIGPTDSSGKYSRIPLSHRVPSPQHADRGGGDAGNLGVAKQGSKIPSPVPKPRKTSFNSKSDPPAEEVMEVTRQSMRKEKSGKNGNGKDAAGKKESGSKKSVVIKGSQEKGGARLVIESQADLKKKIQTVHAKKVTQPPRQVAEAVERTDSADAKLTCRSNSQNENDVTSEPVSTVMFADQTNIQDNSNDQSREKKIPPPVAKRKFHYDSRSLPRRSKFLENAVSFAQQTADCEQYSDMVGSRSSLDDSVLQLAAERHDLFVPEDAEGGESSGYTTGSLRAKRSQKMQSLVDLFERSSDSNMSDSSGSSPGTRHRDRTSSWSFQGQGGQLTPCMEVGRADLDITDDDAFISTMSSSFDQQMLAHSNRQRPTQSRDRYSYTGGAGETLSGGLITSDKENLGEGARSGVDRKSHPPLSSSLSSPSSSAAVKQTTRNVSREPVDIRGRVSSPTRRKRNPDMPTSPRQPASYSQTASPDASKISKNSRPPRPRSSSKTRTQSESSASESDTTHQSEGSTVRFASSRHRAFSATSSSSHSPQLYSESHYKSTTHSSTIHQHQSSDSITGISTSTVHRQTDSQDVDSVLTTSQTSAAAAGGGNQSSTNYTSPQSSRKNSERRNSIKELRQVFERAEGDSTPCDPEPNPADQGRPILRPRVRSTSPQAEGTSEQRPERSNVMRHSIEVSSPSSIQSAQGDVKSQPLRLGPKPFYGSQK